jgi:acetyl-CoA/propionyl-CoA carboxylase carboxyl transferase subunit
LHRRALSGLEPEQVAETEAELVREHEKTADGLQLVVDLGVVDEVIEPSQTPRAVAHAIAGAAPGSWRAPEYPTLRRRVQLARYSG